jgi:DnaK suppressor protein
MRSLFNPDTILKRLAIRESELRAQVAAARQPREVASHDVIDRAEQAATQTLEEVSSAEVERDLSELQDIAHACERVLSGSYGYCVDCGEAIGADRLQASPAAARCTGCQREVEQAGHPRAHPEHFATQKARAH